MRIGRLEIGKWEYPALAPKVFIWFEYKFSSCECHFLTIANILCVWYSKDCKDNSDEANLID